MRLLPPLNRVLQLVALPAERAQDGGADLLGLRSEAVGLSKLVEPRSPAVDVVAEALPVRPQEALTPLASGCRAFFSSGWACAHAGAYPTHVEQLATHR